MSRLLTATAMAGCLALASALPASAAIMRFHATLDGAQQVPSVTTDGKGTANATLDTVKKTLTYRVTYSHLSGPAKAAHFHGPADAGANAGVAVPITGKLTSPIKGSVTLTDAQITDLEAGKYYVNVHTAAHPDGEIRGQVLPRAPRKK